MSATLAPVHWLLDNVSASSSWSPSSSSSSSTGSASVDAALDADRRILSLLYLSFSLFSLVLSLTVILSYLSFRALRQHPHSLVCWRSLCDVLYSAQFIVFFLIQPPSSRSSYCLYFTPLFQFSLLASQSFYFCLALDLWMSLRNPFLSLRSKPLYHAFSFGHRSRHRTHHSSDGRSGIQGAQPRARERRCRAVSQALLLTLLRASPVLCCAVWQPGMEICWLKPSETSTVNALTWSLFFAPTLLFYGFGLLVLLYASSRLSAGLRETFHTREKVLHDSPRYVAAFTVYWTVTGSIYLALWYKEKNGVDLQANFALYAAFACSIVLRAVLDECAWLYSNDVLGMYSRWWRGLEELSVVSTDVNRALRREVLVLTTRGIVLAAEQQSAYERKRGITQPPRPKPSHYPRSLSSSKPSCIRHMTLRKDSAQPVLLSAGAATAVNPTPFGDFAPHVFSYLRSLWGLDTATYLSSILGDTAAMVEKYTEGRSTAFFYFTSDGRFLVKTLTRSEATLLLDILPAYVRHMATNPHSLLCRFVGMHSIAMYSLTLRFVVMQSVFLSPLLIQERYDLKGSTVDRYTGREGRKAGKVLKDLDLLANLILERDDRARFLQQCGSDSRFLMDHGICDYSLLLGIHYTRHKVHPHAHSARPLYPLSVAHSSGAVRCG